MSNNTRILIIGLDGATFDLIEPWVEQQKLPFFARLLTVSSYGRLRSTYPPATFPAWTTFMTGKNPGKHGIYDFTERKPGSYEIRFLNSTFRKATTIWQMLSEQRKKVGVIGLPATYPPEPINGFIICGFDSPVTTSIDDSFIYPRELYSKLRKKLGNYTITDFQELRISEGWHEKALAKMLNSLERKTSYASYLMQKEPWDCFMVLFGETDTVSHHFWMFHDERSPRYDAQKAASLGNAILTIYQKLDEIIQHLTSLIPENTYLIILSDHGSGGAGDKVIHLNHWLHLHGYLHFKPGITWFNQRISWLKGKALEVVPPSLQQIFFRKGSGTIAGKVESFCRFSHIDWNQTRAFSEELNYFPNIWINLKGREPQGIVEPGAPYEALQDELIEKISQFTNPLTNQRIVKRAYKREEIYQGAELNQAPDIVLELNLDGDYSYSLMPSTAASANETIRILRPDEFTGAKGKSMNGSHRMEGIFILKGPSVRKAHPLSTISLMDLAPTILYLLGCPIPPDLDGQVIQEALEKDLLHSPPVRHERDSETRNTPPPEDLTEREATELRKKLKRLGYF